MPHLPVSHYVTFVPVAVTSSSDEPLRNVHIQVTTDRELTLLQLRNVAPELYQQLSRYPGARTQYFLGDRAVTDHDLDIMRSGGGTVIGHPVVFPAAALGDNRNVWLTRITWQLTAENTRKSNGEGYLLFVRSATGYNNESEASHVADALIDQARRDGALSSRYLVWRWSLANTRLNHEQQWSSMSCGFTSSQTLASTTRCFREISQNIRIDKLDLLIRPGVLRRWRRKGV